MSDDSPGWDAIDGALAPLYAGIEPKHYAPAVSPFLGGSSPLHGISAYRRTGPVPHWHFVTYGFSELFAKEWDDVAVSGFGFELTFRLAAAAGAATPPAWALDFLQNLGRYVFGRGTPFAAGHYLNLNGPIAVGSETAIRSIAFVDDPELPPIDTPHGRVGFLQVCGITVDEERALKQWSAPEALGVLAQHLPLMVTDPARGSLLGDPGVAAALAAGASRDGSSTGMLVTDHLSWHRGDQAPGAGAAYTLSIGARQIVDLQAVLPFRLPFGRDLCLAGQEAQIVFSPGRTVTVTERGDALGVTLDAMAQTMVRDRLGPVAGRYRLSTVPDLVLAVRRSEIRNAKGEVVETLG